MKCYDLLFRYIDGEISRKENKELLEMMAKDPELSEDFNTFLEIDYQIEKSNQEFNYPDQFLNEVGSSIHQKMIIDRELAQIKKQLKRDYTKKFVVVPVVLAIIFLSFLISIQNPQLNLQIRPNKQENLKFNNLNSTSFVENRKIGTKQTKNKDRTPKLDLIAHDDQNLGQNQQQGEITSDWEIERTNDNKLDFFPTNEINSTNLAEKFEYSANRDLENKNQFTKTNPALLHTQISYNKINSVELEFQPNILKTNQILPISFTTPILTNSKIELNTLFGTDFVQIGVANSNKVVNSFTQSFAARITHNISLGVETGVMMLNANTKKITDITLNNKFNGSTILSLDNNTDQQPVLIRIEGIETTPKNLFWIGMFFEQNLLEIDKLALSGRLTMGAGDYGAISSLKLIGKYNLSRNFTLTLGTDAKVFEGSFNESGINRLNSTVSLIYGIKITF